jgi:DMSO/TMAO reductase YedYZ molybdopterin-dependent catalytic subunit
MKKASKIVIVTFMLLIALVIPLYYYVQPPAVESGSIEITGNVHNPQNFTFSQLQTITPVTIQATLTSSGSPQENGVFNYTGVTLKEILKLAQASDNVTLVYVQASDAYGATLTIKDAMNEKTILAYAKDGSSMTDLKKGGEGPLRLVIGGDKFAQRWVKGVVLINVT